MTTKEATCKKCWKTLDEIFERWYQTCDSCFFELDEDEQMKDSIRPVEYEAPSDW